MLEPGDVVAEKYQVKECLGQGGMGQVYLVRHALTERRFALKVLSPALMGTACAGQGLVREALAAGRVEHRNVVDVFDVGEHEGAVYLVMEYLDGRPLSALLATGELSDRAILTLMLRAMEGVAAAHDAGVVHRDLKPENVFVCVNSDGTPGEPRVMDFGISRLPEALTCGAESTGSLVVGTPHFMCIEQLDCEAQLDARVDVYALGVSLYRAFTGRVPFEGASFAELAEQIRTGRPVPLDVLRPDLPPLLCQVVMRAMARRREHRHPNVRALAHDLAPFARQLSALPARLRHGPLPAEDARAPSVLAASVAPAERARLSPWWLVGATAVVTSLTVAFLLRPVPPVPAEVPPMTSSRALLQPRDPPLLLDTPSPALTTRPIVVRPRRHAGRRRAERSPAVTSPVTVTDQLPMELAPRPRRTLDELDPYVP